MKQEETAHDKKLFAALDPKEVAALAKDLGISRTTLLRMAMKVSESGNISRSVKKITALVQSLQDQTKGPAQLEGSPAESVEQPNNQNNGNDKV
jgi:hypothetical protein